MSASAATIAAPRELSATIVTAIVRMVKRKNYRQGVIGVRGRPIWSRPDILHVDGEVVRVAVAPSALAMWEVLAERRDEPWLVVITDRDKEDLGSSLCAHLVNERVLPPDLWQVVEDSFGATQGDPALLRSPQELAEALLAHMPPKGWPPVPAGLLTRDIALESLVQRVLGIPPDRLDAMGLLEWTLDPVRRGGLDPLPETVRGIVATWLPERSGLASRPTLQVVGAGHGADALALALLAGLLSDGGRGGLERAEARGLLGHRYGGTTPQGALAIEWADAARGLIEARSPGDPAIAHQLTRAEAILKEIGHEGLAETSAVLPSGFDQRIQLFADALQRTMTHHSRLGDAEKAYAELARHLLAERFDDRRERAQMALRALRWLVGGRGGAPSTIVQAADRHVFQDAWVDRARMDVWRGDDDAANAYGELYRRVSEARERDDEQFAGLLATYTQNDPDPGSLLTVERVVPKVVLPLAKQVPVLLLVIDAMSAAIATAVAEGIADDGWRELLVPGSSSRRPVVSAVPTVTEVCRTSLFAGRLMRGGQREEQVGLGDLASHADLRAVLFHKADLERSRAGESLPEKVRSTLQDLETRLVGVVLNTIDDSLDRADPGGMRWGVREIAHLPALLRAAREVGRAVVIAADHGHVIERRDSELRTQASSQTARWRPAEGGGPPGDGELLVRGRRVEFGGSVIVPWRERLRYGPVRAGYHGGISPAEAVTTLLVFGTSVPNGWDLAPPQEPDWWLGSTQRDTHPERVQAAPPKEPQQPSLFHDGLVEQLLASDTYKLQVRRSRRAAVDQDKMVIALGALLGSGGRLPDDRLAAAMSVPRYRLSGMIAAMRRVLNVDGYEVLGYDPDEVTVVLDADLLREQFGLTDG